MAGGVWAGRGLRAWVCWVEMEMQEESGGNDEEKRAIRFEQKTITEYYEMFPKSARGA